MSIPNEQIPVATEQATDFPLGTAGQAAALAPQEVNPDNPHWGPLVALGLWLLSVFLVLLLPAIVALPYIVIRYMGVENAQEVAGKDPTVLLLSVIGVVPAHILTFAAAWGIVTQFGKRPFWSALGWSWSKRFGFWACAGLALALYLIGSFLADLIGGEATDIEMLVNSSTAVRLTLAVLAATTGPFVEEVVYRGVIYSALQKRIGMIWSVVLVSFLFSFVHVFQYRNHLGVILVITMLSVTLTLVRAWTGRLLPCFIIHLVFNGVQSLIIAFHPYIKEFEKGLEQKTGFLMMLQQALYAFI